MVFSIDTLGFHIKSKSPLVLLFLPIPILIVYLIGCITLWAFVGLFGILEFTWVNGFYTAILLSVIKIIFAKSDD